MEIQLAVARTSMALFRDFCWSNSKNNQELMFLKIKRPFKG